MPTSSPCRRWTDGSAAAAGADQVAELARRLGWHGLFAAIMIGTTGALRPAPADSANERVDVRGDGDEPAYGIGLLSRHPLTAASAVLVRGGRLTETTTDPAHPSDHRIFSATVVLPDRPRRTTLCPDVCG